MRVHVWAIWLVALSFTQGVEYNVTRETSISEESTLLNVFPTEKTWKTAQISAEKKIYTEASLSKSFYRRECENEIELQPVYFYPGETVRIKCFMCNVALTFNGSPKGWARVKNIDDFMAKGEKFGAEDGPEIEMIENAEFFEVPGASRKQKEDGDIRGDPFYYQEDGTLVIEDTNSFSQGVYFCFDEDSAASQRHFHVLIPILPLFSVAEDDQHLIEGFSGGCSDSTRSFPNHNSIELFEGQFFDDQETCIQRSTTNNSECYDMRKSARFAGCENPAVSCRIPLSSPTLPQDVVLSISLLWDPWSDCKNGKQKRRGTCFLSLEQQIPDSYHMTDRWKWIRKLNRMSKNVAFRDGVPLFSGILASWLYDVDRLESCSLTNLGSEADPEGYDSFFKEVLVSISPNSEEPSFYREPENAFRYCLKYSKMGGLYDSMTGTHAEDERSC